MSNASTLFQRVVEVAQRQTYILGGDHPDTVKSIARVCVMAIQEGIWGLEKWVPRPAELPDVDAEMRETVASRKAADRELKRAILDWRWSNEQIECEGAERLRVCVLNFADLEKLRAQGDEEAQKLQEAIWVHAKRTFHGVDVSTAELQRDDLDRWCRRVVGAHNPVPVWLRTRAYVKLFTPRASSEPTKVGGVVRNMFGGEEDDA